MNKREKAEQLRSIVELYDAVEEAKKGFIEFEEKMKDPSSDVYKYHCECGNEVKYLDQYCSNCGEFIGDSWQVFEDE